MKTRTHFIDRIATDLISLGVEPGSVLLVHSSLRSLGRARGGAATVIEGLEAGLGPRGTLLLPALSYEIVTPRSPVFDVNRTHSNVGAIPERFRTLPGVRRSVHPTHSVCGKGPLCGELLADHIRDDTPCGPHSPFHLLPDYRGSILMLGCGLGPNTSMHAIEELVEPPYLFDESRCPYTLVLEDGRRITRVYKTHGFAGWRQRYDRVAQVLSPGGLRRGDVLEAPSFLLDAAALREAAVTRLREDPVFFVEHVGDRDAG